MAGQLAKIPGGARLLETVLFQKLRHKLSLRVNVRQNSHFTGFLRLPSQYEALAGPVCEALRATRGEAPLRIAVLGCSNGAEAYTIASVLRHQQPALNFSIRGYDISGDCIRQAGHASYGREEIYNNQIITETFVESTFNRDGDRYVVKPHIAERVSFQLGNVLAPSLVETVGSPDVVFAQNFLFHMTPDVARKALDNIRGLLEPGAAVFIDGVDLDLRYRFVRANGLRPLDCKISEIHEEARRARSVGWPYRVLGARAVPDLSPRLAATLRDHLPGGVTRPHTCDTGSMHTNATFARAGDTRILLVSYHFPPSASVGGQRMANFAACMSEIGYAPHILTIREQDIEQLDRGRLKGLERLTIHRAGVRPTALRRLAEGKAWLRRLLRRRPAPVPKETDQFVASAAPGRESVSHRLRRYILSFVVLPDFERGWIGSATIEGVRQIRQHRIDWFVTSCPPYSAHVVGLLIKALTGKRWVADFRDPWMTTGSKRLYPTSAASLRVERWLERQVMEKADVIAFNVERLRNAYRDRYAHVPREKFVFIPNGISVTAAADAPVAKYRRVYAVVHRSALRRTVAGADFPSRCAPD